MRPRPEWVPVLRLCEVFRGLTDTELLLVARLCRVHTFTSGETVIAGGNRRDEAFVIRNGSVAVSVKADGEETTLDLLGPGDLVSPVGLVPSREVGPYTFRALSEVSALGISGDRFHELSLAYPQVGVKVLEAIIVRLNHRLHQALFLTRER